MTFQVDADGLLSVSAEEETTGLRSEIQVKPSYGLSDEEVTTMLQQSYQHAADDMQSRQLREKQLEAKQLLESLQAALDADGEALLSAAEQEQLQQAMTSLSALLNSKEINAIAAQTQTLGELSEPFAARRMDASIKRALQGKSLAQLSDSEET